MAESMEAFCQLIERSSEHNHREMQPPGSCHICQDQFPLFLQGSNVQAPVLSCVCFDIEVEAATYNIN